MRMAIVAIAVFLATFFDVPCASAQFPAPGFGLQTGRATPADAAALRTEIAELIAGEREFNSKRDYFTDALGIERQREQLGGTADSDHPDVAADVLLRDARRDLIRLVLNPALQIAGNHAATCELARSLMSRITQVEQQAQVILGDQSFGSYGDPGSVVGRAWRTAQRRCLEEAFDECMVTGNGQSLIIALTQWGRQPELILGDDDRARWDNQIAYLFRRCTVYRLGYHMEVRDAVMGRSLTADGSFTLLFRPAPNASVVITSFAGGMWMAPRQQDSGKRPDIHLSAIVCGEHAPSCHALEPMWSGISWGLVEMQRDMTEQTIRVVRNRQEAAESAAEARGLTNGRVTVTDEVVGDPIWGEVHDGGVVILRTTRHREGRDRLVLNFGPPVVGLYLDAGGPWRQDAQANAAGTDLFYEAVAKEDGQEHEEGNGPIGLSPFVDQGALPRAEISPLVVNDDHWSRGTYPKMFQAGSARGANPTERTTFEITHRPDLFPQDEIDPNYELLPTPPPELIPLPPL
jgi:hypothetical protein